MIKWFFKTNQKDIWTLYQWLAIISGIIGIIIAIWIRMAGDEENYEMYNVWIRTNAYMMIIFMGIPGIIGGIGKWLVPIIWTQINWTTEMEYPRIKKISFWVLPPSIIILLISSIIWEEINTAKNLVIISLILASISTILVIRIMIGTIWKMRTPGMTRVIVGVVWIVGMIIIIGIIGMMVKNIIKIYVEEMSLIMNINGINKPINLHRTINVDMSGQIYLNNMFISACDGDKKAQLNLSCILLPKQIKNIKMHNIGIQNIEIQNLYIKNNETENKKMFNEFINKYNIIRQIQLYEASTGIKGRYILISLPNNELPNRADCIIVDLWTYEIVGTIQIKHPEESGFIKVNTLRDIGNEYKDTDIIIIGTKTIEKYNDQIQEFKKLKLDNNMMNHKFIVQDLSYLHRSEVEEVEQVMAKQRTVFNKMEQGTFKRNEYVGLMSHQSHYQIGNADLMKKILLIKK